MTTRDHLRAWLRRAVRLECPDGEHEWEFYSNSPDPDGVEFTGYLERCQRCGAIQQVPQ